MTSPLFWPVSVTTVRLIAMPCLKALVMHRGIGEAPQRIALIPDEVRRRYVRPFAVDVDFSTADRALDAFVDECHRQITSCRSAAGAHQRARYKIPLPPVRSSGGVFLSRP